MSRFLGGGGGGRRSGGGPSMVDDVLPLKHKSSFTLAKDKRQMQESLQPFQQPSRLTSSAEPAPKMLQGLVISSIPLTGTDYKDSLDVTSSHGDGSSYGSSYYRPPRSRNGRLRHKNENNDSRSSWRNGGSGGRNQKSGGGNPSEEVMSSNKQKNNQSPKSKPKVPMLDLDTRPSVRVVPTSHTQRNLGEERDQDAVGYYRQQDDRKGRSSSKRTGATAAAMSVAGALSAKRLLGKGNRSLHSRKRNQNLSKQQQKQSKRTAEIAFAANGSTAEDTSPDTRDMPDQQPQPRPVKVLEERVELVAMEDAVGTPFIRILMSKTTTTTTATATAPSSNQNTNNKLPKLPPLTKDKKQFGKRRMKSVKSASARSIIPSKVAVPMVAAAASVVASAGSSKSHIKDCSPLSTDGVDEGAKTVAPTTTRRSILAKKFSAKALPKILPSHKKTDKSETEAVAAVSIDEGAKTVAPTTTRRSILAKKFSAKALPKILPSRKKTDKSETEAVAAVSASKATTTTTEKETIQLPRIVTAGEEPNTLEPTDNNRPPSVAVTPPIVSSSANNSVATTPQQQLQLLKSQRTESLKVAVNEEKQNLVAKKQHEKLMQKRLKQQKKQEKLELKLRKKLKREVAKRLKKQQQLLQKKEKVPVAAKLKAAMAKNGERNDSSVAAVTKAVAAEESVTEKVKVMTLVLPCASTEGAATMADRGVVDTTNDGDVSSVSGSTVGTQEEVGDGDDLEATTTYSVSTGAFETDIDEVASVKSTRLDRFVDNVIRSFTNNPDDEAEESDENDVDDDDDEEEEDEDGAFTVNEKRHEVDVVQNRRGLIMSPNASRMQVSDEVIMGHTNTWASALGWNAKDNSYGHGEDDVRDLRMVDSDKDDRDVRILDSRDDDDDEDEDEEDFDDESESDSSGWSYDEEDHHTAADGEDISYEDDDDDDEEADESWSGILFDDISPRKSGGGGGGSSRRQQRASTASKQQPVDDNTSIYRAMNKFRGHAEKLGVTERDLFQAVSNQNGEDGTDGGGGDTISKTKSKETTTSGTTTTVGVVRREDFFSDDFMRSQKRRGYV